MRARQPTLPFDDDPVAGTGEHPFVAQLAALCRERPTANKWIFVPGHAQGNALGERLARTATSWVNLRFITPLEIAIRMAGPFLLERGIEPSEDTLGPALVMRLLLDLPADPGYFRPMAEQPSLAASLWSALRELRFAGVGSERLTAGAFMSSAKHGELHQLVAAYERYLEEHRLADMPMVFAEACRRPELCPLASSDAVTEWPDARWPPLVRRFLDGLPGERVAPRTVAVPGSLQPRRLAASRLAAARELPVSGRAAHLAWLLAPGDLPRRLGPTDAIHIFHAGGREAEIDEVARRVLESRSPLDTVEIVCGSHEHVWLAWERAVGLGWPVTVSAGLPAAFGRPGRALLAWCEWVENDFAAAILRRMLQSGDLRPASFRDPNDDGDRLSPGHAARLLLRAEVSWGRSTYAPAFQRLAAFYAARARDPEHADDERARAAQHERWVRRLAAWVSALVDAVPEPEADGTVRLTTVVDAACTVLASTAAHGSALDAATAVALGDALAELRALRDYRCSIRAALGFVRERIGAVAVGRERPRPGHLHVSALTEATLDARPRTFVVGLEEGRVFPVVAEDPVLLDAERQAIDPALRLSSDRLDEHVHATLQRLATIGVQADDVCVSYSCRDTREFRETFPSWLVLHAFRVVRGDPHLSYGALAEFLGEPVSAVPSSQLRALSDAGWWLAGARGAERGREQVLAAFPLLALGAHAEAERASQRFTTYDGLVVAAGESLDPTRQGGAVSATTLEDAARCPFSFFLRHGLGVEPVEEERRDFDMWLDAATRGGELHALYAAILRRARQQGRHVTVAGDLEPALALSRARLAELRVELPPPSEEAFHREATEFLEDIEGFVEAEARQRDVDPVAFEVAFGTPADGDEPLATPTPVPLEIGKGRRLLLRGRIDRIDRLDRSRYQVVDYKTGQFWRDDKPGPFARGTRLQHALYGVAATTLLQTGDERATVVRALYRFTTARGLWRRIEIPAPSRERLTGVLDDLVDVVAAGTFVQATKAQSCRWCRFGTACGRDPAVRAARKLDADAEGRLAAFTRLQGHA